MNEELSKFGEASLAVTDINEFVKRIEEAAIKEKCKLVKHGYVKYYDEKSCTDISMLEDIIQDISNIAFYKRKLYEKQSEYRFLFQCKTSEDYIKLDIGDISSISQFFWQGDVPKMKVRVVHDR